jgi:antitoxin component YwqK of YwqJK toxin-antitoxin module
MDRTLRVPDDELDLDDNLVATLNGDPFTGTAYEDRSDGSLSEMSYRDGLQEGLARDVDADGRVAVEAFYREGALHGYERRYGVDGDVDREKYYEYGILIAERVRMAEGLIEVFTIDPESENYALLQRYRAEKRWPGPI